MTDTIDVAALVERLRSEQSDGWSGDACAVSCELAEEAATALQSQADALAEARREGDENMGLARKYWRECEVWKSRATTAEASLATMREALVIAEAVLRNADPTSTTDGGRIPETTTGEAASIARRALGGSNAE